MNPFREIKEVRDMRLFSEFKAKCEKLGSHSLCPESDMIEGQFAVVGNHPELGSGILFWHRRETHATYNSKVVNHNGGESVVISRKDAIIYMRNENELLSGLERFINGECDG
jgi:hypothetical protein